jgi:hypothetical protein
VTGESLLVSSIGGVSSSDSSPSSSKDVQDASEPLLPILEGPFDRRRPLEFERLEEFRSLSDRRNVPVGMICEDGNPALLVEPLLGVSLAFLTVAYVEAAANMSDGEFAIS